VAYLHPVRLTFAGQFQADVSTVNNDVRHFDDTAFAPSWQELQTNENLNGWWNPTGSGAFRLVGCTVTAATDGTPSGSDNDRVIRAVVTGAGDRSAGKLVDIDPQWQLASTPWGLAVRLLRTDGRELLRGEYRPHAFRDLWFSRLSTQGGDAAASSTFQSVLEDVVFNEEAISDSPALRALQEVTADDRLSIRLTTFGYDGDAASPTFTIGTLVGTIGPYLLGEPESYIRGRRFAPASGFSSYGAATTYFSGLVQETGHEATLLLDLSNALTISDRLGTALSIGQLHVGVLRDEGITENTPVGPEEFMSLAEITYAAPRWLQATGGVIAVPLDADQGQAVASHPLALVNQQPYNPGGSGQVGSLGVVAIRETAGGLFVGAEPGVLRLDPSSDPADGPARATVTLTATRYGAPLDEVSVEVRQLGCIPAQGAGTVPGAPDVSGIAVPDIGVPVNAFSVEPADVPITGGTGMFEVRAVDPGNPRGYLDGQLYLVGYRLPGQPNASRHPFDVVVAHVRDARDPLPEPTWDDVKPILAKYSNLYPIMSQGFIDLCDEEAVKGNRDLLLLAFNAEETDPNHMPVTRDLSEAKRLTVIRWLTSLPTAQAGTNKPLRSRMAAGAVRPSTPLPRPDAAPAPSAVGDLPFDSKERFAKGFLDPPSTRADA
jgi:hypothetical protein